jgi:hypothetical protein
MKHGYNTDEKLSLAKGKENFLLMMIVNHYLRFSQARQKFNE